MQIYNWSETSPFYFKKNEKIPQKLYASYLQPIFFYVRVLAMKIKKDTDNKYNFRKTRINLLFSLCVLKIVCIYALVTLFFFSAVYYWYEKTVTFGASLWPIFLRSETETWCMRHAYHMQHSITLPFLIFSCYCT